MTTRRVARLNDQIRADLSELIRKEMKDPRLAGLISVTGVEVTPDIRHAKVFVSVLGSPEDEKHTLQALRSAAGFLRSQLADLLTTRRAPELHFVKDESIQRGQRLLSLFREVEAQKPAERPPAEGSDEAPAEDAGDAAR
jgi:ribosome-binding factor A